MCLIGVYDISEITFEDDQRALLILEARNRGTTWWLICQYDKKISENNFRTCKSISLCRRIAKSNNIIGSYFITHKNGAGGVSVQTNIENFICRKPQSSRFSL